VAGTPLIKSEGLDAVRALRREFPAATIVADMKVMDAGRVETECAAKAGANIVHVLAAASDATIAECVEAARRYDARIAVDLVGLAVEGRLVERALEAAHGARVPVAGIVALVAGIGMLCGKCQAKPPDSQQP
jgi:3-hexulose-6-phosphate synthase/6-phospho-3-hexuloisomerase